MAEFTSPVDIANRALQHCGAIRIGTQGFSENSRQAQETSFVYGKLRRAELRRNLWRFSIRRVVLRPLSPNSRVLAPSLWGSTITYQAGSMCSDVQGNIWLSTAVNNVNRAPGYAPGWEAYYGPMTIEPYDSTTAYWAGELAYVAAGDGTYSVFYSLEDNNSDNPATPAAWSATTTYRAGDLASVSSTPYVSLIDLNLNQAPASTSQSAWNAATTYAANDKVMASNGYTYQSIAGGNLNNNPIYDIVGAFWTQGALTAWSTTTGTRGTGSAKWQPLDAVLQDARILNAVSASPSPQSFRRSTYRLPSNYLRMASLDPRAGSVSYLGAPSGLYYNDWLIEGDYIITRETYPIMLRFGADFVDVSKMDDMFCEGLACRVAYEVCEILTQSSGKRQSIASEYTKFMGEARMVNAIELGPTEPPEDDWVSCRL